VLKLTLGRSSKIIVFGLLLATFNVSNNFEGNSGSIQLTLAKTKSLYQVQLI